MVVSRLASMVLPVPGGGTEQQVVAAGSGDFECPFCLVLADNVGHIAIRFIHICFGQTRQGLNWLIAIQMCTDFEQMCGAITRVLLLRAASAAFVVGNSKALPAWPQASEVGRTPSTARNPPDSASSPITSY